MAIILKEIKVVTKKYHIYNKAREVGDVYLAKPNDATKMERKGLISLIKAKKDKPVPKEDKGVV